MLPDEARRGRIPLGRRADLSGGGLGDPASLAVLAFFATSSWEMAIQGCLYGEDRPFAERELDREKEKFRTFFRKTMKWFRLSQRGKMTRDLSKLNIIAWWYTYNMFAHYRVPRGLEQYGGAPGERGMSAGGRRNICRPRKKLAYYGNGPGFPPFSVGRRSGVHAPFERRKDGDFVSG
ncbi:MAG: hypothetical protein C6P37_08030 [Caldibacillus debilis]|uniref:Uncharacterized protein n=2 Tax=Caldibacillus debilis TaxID=301148 RepID=A0A3E0K528_9BACI|nr:MAG: hypothetical protein C6P37_08030 [Caldibacillus debilis]